MHIDQPPLAPAPFLNTRKSKFLVDLVADPDRLEAFRELSAILIALGRLYVDVAGMAAT